MELIIKQFGKQELGVLRKDIQEVLDQIKTKYGLSELTLKGIRFSSASFTSTITGSVTSEEAEDRGRNQIKFFALSHGLPENLLGCEFLLDGAVFTITRVAFQNPKFPIIAHCKNDGRSFKFSVQRIKELLDRFRVINI